MNPIHLRFASDSDAEGLIALIGLCFQQYPNCLLDVDNELPELKTIATSFKTWRGQFWVAEQDEQIVACVGWTPSVTTAHRAQSEGLSGVELRKLYVHPSIRRQGLGGKLCAMIEEVCLSQDAPFVELWSDTKFAEAHRLYESRGYVRGVHTRELHDLSQTVEYYYRKPMSAARE